MSQQESDAVQQRRENPDPNEQVKPLPFAIMLVIAALFTFGVVYIAETPLNLPGTWGDQRVLADMAAPAKSATADGAALFAANCVACHQATGLGVPGAFPPLAGSEYLNGKPDVTVQILLHGIKGSITVKGNTFNGEMPNFGAKFSDAEIAAVATHVRSQWGNKGVAIDTAAVAKGRDLTKAQTTPWNGGQDLEKYR
ncbi:hypothetical protein GCM10010971_00110 [Silvimonas amylolytica]|uniref:Cytochrome c domain-containing protein n=2 Tax=Silvimonas amylolytica TaxID=449663 RepID=A0ABQ2PF43_9NEIS|nr:hypothetical protein GCM10010971_00110 [Silvimonas amylolytica]